jgi:hypothetical protein
MRRIAPLVLLLAAASAARADTQTVLGAAFDVRGADDPARRRVSVTAAEDVGTPNLLVGDPTVAGATLRVVVRGPGGASEQTFDLPAAGWRSYYTRHDWPVYKGLRYTNRDTGGGVRRVVVERGGYASPEGTPPPTEPQPGRFRLRLQVAARGGPVDVVPPDPGAEGGIELTLGGGDTYCVLFGGAAGGVVRANTARRFGVRAPTAEGCP